MEFCCSLYKYLLDEGRHYLHEHPWPARSWALPCIENIPSQPALELIQGHICRFLMETHVEGRGREMQLVNKPTGFMSSSRYILDEMDKTCNGDHIHTPLVGGKAAGAAIYPQALCEAICRGVAGQKNLCQKSRPR